MGSVDYGNCEVALGSPGTDETSIGSLNYHAFQASYRRALANGLAFNASFTLSRTFGLAQCGGDFYQSCIQNPYNLAAEYGPTDLDIPLIFTLNATYRLPFGKDGQYLTTGKAGAIFGGFQLNTILGIRSGQVINPTNGVNSDTANVGGGNQRINLIGEPESGCASPARQLVQRVRVRLSSRRYLWHGWNQLSARSGLLE